MDVIAADQIVMIDIFLRRSAKASHDYIEIGKPIPNLHLRHPPLSISMVREPLPPKLDVTQSVDVIPAAAACNLSHPG